MLQDLLVTTGLWQRLRGELTLPGHDGRSKKECTVLQREMDYGVSQMVERPMGSSQPADGDIMRASF